MQRQVEMEVEYTKDGKRKTVAVPEDVADGKELDWFYSTLESEGVNDAKAYKDYTIASYALEYAEVPQVRKRKWADLRASSNLAQDILRAIEVLAVREVDSETWDAVFKQFDKWFRDAEDVDLIARHK